MKKNYENGFAELGMQKVAPVNGYEMTDDELENVDGGCLICLGCFAIGAAFAGMALGIALG